MTSATTERAVLAAVIFVVLLSQVMLYPGIRFIVEGLGATTDLQASMWFVVAEFSAFVVFAIVWGAISDRTAKRAPYIVLGALGGAAGYVVLVGLPVALGVTMSFEQILAVRFVQGAMTIGAFSLAMTMLMDLPGGHGANMGAAGIAIGSGTALGAPVGGLIADIGPLAPLVAAGLLLSLVAPLGWLLTDRAPPADRETVRDAVRGLLETPPLGLPFAFGFIDRLTAGFFSLVGVFYFQDHFGLTPMETGIVLALFFVPFAALQYPLGVLSDRIGRTIPVVVGSIGYGVGIIFVGSAPTIGVAGAGMVAVGVLGALVSPATMALVTDISPDGDRGASMAGFNMAGSLGFLTGLLAGGLLADGWGYGSAFLIVGSLEIAIALLAAPLFVRLRFAHDPLFRPD